MCVCVHVCGMKEGDMAGYGNVFLIEYFFTLFNTIAFDLTLNH